jgi:hypothetical protein
MEDCQNSLHCNSHVSMVGGKWHLPIYFCHKGAAFFLSTSESSACSLAACVFSTLTIGQQAQPLIRFSLKNKESYICISLPISHQDAYFFFNQDLEPSSCLLPALLPFLGLQTPGCRHLLMLLYCILVVSTWILCDAQSCCPLQSVPAVLYSLLLSRTSQPTL